MKGRAWKEQYAAKVYGIIVGIVLVLCVICAAAAIVIIRNYSNEQYGKANLDRRNGMLQNGTNAAYVVAYGNLTTPIFLLAVLSENSKTENTFR